MSGLTFLISSLPISCSLKTSAQALLLAFCLIRLVGIEPTIVIISSLIKSMYCFGAKPKTLLVIGPILLLITLVISFSIAVLRSINTDSLDIPSTKAVFLRVLVIISFTSSTSSGVTIFKSSTGIISLPDSVSASSSKSGLLASAICLASSLSKLSVLNLLASKPAASYISFFLLFNKLNT